MEFDSLITSTNPSNNYAPKLDHVSTARADSGSVVAKTNEPTKVPDTSHTAKASETRNEYKEEQQKERPITEEEIKKTIDDANMKIKPTFTEFQYKIHDKTHTLMVKVVDAKTKEVIREIPPEKTVDALAKMWELVGILVDEKG